MSRHLVFVYGTLRRGGSNFHRLRDSAQVYDGSIPVSEGLAMFSYFDHYPFIVSDKTIASVIRGEIYEISDEVLADLDILEGISSGLYTREVLPLDRLHLNRIPDSASTIKHSSCFVYVGSGRSCSSDIAVADRRSCLVTDEAAVQHGQRPE